MAVLFLIHTPEWDWKKMYRTSVITITNLSQLWPKKRRESRWLGEILITSDVQMAPPLWQKAKRNKRASWWSEKAGLKLNIKKAEIMASDPIISRQIVEEAIETGENLFSWAPKSLKMLTSNEVKRCLLLGRKVMTNLDSILKSRYYFANKVHLVKDMVFPVIIYGCELDHKDSWAPRN